MLDIGKKKKVVILEGRVSMPLQIARSAVIYHDGMRTITSLVVNIKEASKNLIVFETLNSIYCVVPAFIPNRMIADEKMPVCA